MKNFIACREIDVSPFQREGFQVFQSVIPPEIVLEVREFLSGKVLETVLTAMQALGCESERDFLNVVNEIAAGGRGGVQSLTKTTRDALSGHFSLETRLSPILRKVPQSPGFSLLLRKLLSCDKLFMHMPPTARYVLPGNLHAGVPAHQDVSYNKHMSNFVTVWVPLVDIDDKCGGVTVFQGSGTIPELPTDQKSSEFWQKGIPTLDYNPIHCQIKAGDVLALNKFIIHRSAANLSDRTRISIDFRFFGESDCSSKHYLDMQSGQILLN